MDFYSPWKQAYSSKGHINKLEFPSLEDAYVKFGWNQSPGSEQKEF